MIPKNPYSIVGRLQSFRRGIVFFADVVIYFVLALMSLLLLLLFFDEKILSIAYYIIASDNISHFYIAHTYANYTPSIIMLGFFLIVFMYTNVFLGIMRLIVDSWKFFIANDHDTDVIHAYHPIVIIIPLLFLLLFYTNFKIFVLNIITNIGYKLAQLIGLL
jgi:hypothetical protein